MMNNSIQKQYFDLKKTPKYAPMPDLTKKVCILTSLWSPRKSVLK